MLIAEIENPRRLFLEALEAWLDGEALLNINSRKSLASTIKKLADPKFRPTVPVIYRAINIGKFINSIKNNKPIKLKNQGASSFSGSIDLANWFFDEILESNSIIFKKTTTSDAIVDFNKVRQSLTPEEQNEFPLLAYGNDHEIVVIDSPAMLTVNPDDIVKIK